MNKPSAIDNGALTGSAGDIRSAVLRHVLEHIRQGTWPVGSRLPTEAELAEQFSTSRSNVNQAMRVLERNGVVRRYRRRGTFAAQVPSATLDRALYAVRPRTSQVHVIAPLDPTQHPMHVSSAVLCQLETRLNHEGMQVVHESMPDSPDPVEFGKVVRRLTRLSRKGSGGLVLLIDLPPRGHRSNDDAVLLPFVRELQDYPGRVCWFNRSGVSLAGWPHDAVSFSPLDEGIGVGRYLLQHQVRSVICVGYPGALWGRMRVAGVKLAIERDAGPVDLQTHWTGFEQAQRTALFEQLLDRHDQWNHRPTFVVPNDHYAAMLLDIARERGMKCPETFCVVSFNNDDRYRRYNITTVAPPANRVGDAIGQLFSDRMQRPSSAAVNLKLKSVIVERATFVAGDPASSTPTPNEPETINLQWEGS